MPSPSTLPTTDPPMPRAGAWAWAWACTPAIPSQDCQHCGNLMRLSQEESLVHSPLPCKYLAHPSKKVAILLPPWVGSMGLWGEEISELTSLPLAGAWHVRPTAGRRGGAGSQWLALVQSLRPWGRQCRSLYKDLHLPGNIPVLEGMQD